MTKSIIALIIILVCCSPVKAVEAISYRIGIDSVAKVSSKDNVTIYIKKVLIDSPAQLQGIIAGDRIVEINNHPIRNYNEFKQLVNNNQSNIYTIKKSFWNTPIFDKHKSSKKIEIVGMAFNQSSNAPSWNEFCPSDYIFASVDVNSGYLKNRRMANYWANRRYSFDKEIATCTADKTNQSSCYMQVRQLEELKNNQLRNEAIAASQALQQTINGLNTQNQLNQINTNLNRIRTGY